MPASRTSGQSSLQGALILAAMFSGLLLGCDAPEVTETFELSLEPNAVDARVGGTWRVAEIGRIAMDWRVTNSGDVAASYSLLAQAQTSGDVLDGACDTLLARTRRISATDGVDDDETAPPEGVSVDTITALEQAFLVGISSDTHTWLRLRVPNDSTYRLVASSPVALQVFPVNGELPLAPRFETTGETSCVGIAAAWEFSMFAGDYNVRFPATDDRSIRFLAEEKCESLRDVGRTCAGSAGSARELVLEVPIEPGGSVTGRMGVDLLGVGDQLSVELRCGVEAANCEGLLEMAIVTEPLDCRDDDACRGARSCSEDGYCVADEGAGCSASGRRHSGGLLVAIGLFAVSIRCRRRFALASVACTVLVFATAQSTASAAEPGGQVYTEIGVSSYSFAGRLGGLTSPGIGVELSQGLQFGLIGAQMSVGTSYYLTRQRAPPHTHLLQTFQVVVGPRLSVPLGVLRLFASTDYVGSGFLTNSLAAITGPRTLAHGIGATVAARFEGALPIYAEVRFGVRSLFGLDVPATSYGLTVTFGVAGAI
jgi:hypothetical protein